MPGKELVDLYRDPSERMAPVFVSFALAMVNMVVCWYNITITRIAMLAVTNNYVSDNYVNFFNNSETYRIDGIQRLSDLTTVYFTIAFSMLFIMVAWHLYEKKMRKGQTRSLLQIFSMITGWQMLEVPIAFGVFTLFSYYLMDGNTEMFQSALAQNNTQMIVSIICLVLSVVGITVGFLLRRKKQSANVKMVQAV